jgi:hypothetical protein
MSTCLLRDSREHLQLRIFAPDLIQPALGPAELLLQRGHFPLAFSELIKVLDRLQHVLLMIFDKLLGLALQLPDGCHRILAFFEYCAQFNMRPEIAVGLMRVIESSPCRYFDLSDFHELLLVSQSRIYEFDCQIRSAAMFISKTIIRDSQLVQIILFWLR